MDGNFSFQCREIIDDMNGDSVAQHPRICNVQHAHCNLPTKCTCTTTLDSQGKHPGSHTSPHHIWF